MAVLLEKVLIRPGVPFAVSAYGYFGIIYVKDKISV